MDTVFEVYKLINTDSICGYPYLAIEDKNKIYLSFSVDHFSLERYYWEVEKWIRDDYSKTVHMLYFNTSSLDSLIQANFKTGDFSLTIYSTEVVIKSIVLVLGRHENYCEIDFGFSEGKWAFEIKTNNRKHENIYVPNDFIHSLLQCIIGVNTLKNNLFKNALN